MKNENTPMIQALKKRSRIPEPSFKIPEPDRLFQIKKEDIPVASKFTPGDDSKFVLHGKVRSMHDDGSMMMHVYKVEHKQDTEDVKSAPKEQINVKTQESHSP